MPEHDLRLTDCPCGSKKPFAQCHGAITPASLAPPAPAPMIAPLSLVTRKLDIGAGQNPAAGFEGVDQWPGSQHVVNLADYPWPFDDESVKEIHCSHFAEHVPMIFVDARGKEVPWGHPGGRDALFRLFDEFWRILVPSGFGRIIVPNARNNRAFQDPTHRRFFVEASFLYLNEEWRRMNGLDHYNAECNFGVNIIPYSGRQELQLLAPQAQQHRITHEWNVVDDWMCTIEKLPRLPPRPK